MEVCTKNILYRFIEGQTHFGMPRGAKTSLALNDPKIGCSSFKFKHSLRACTASGKFFIQTVCKLTNENP